VYHRPNNQKINGDESYQTEKEHHGPLQSRGKNEAIKALSVRIWFFYLVNPYLGFNFLSKRKK